MFTWLLFTLVDRTHIQTQCPTLIYDKQKEIKKAHQSFQFWHNVYNVCSFSCKHFASVQRANIMNTWLILSPFILTASALKPRKTLCERVRGYTIEINNLINVRLCSHQCIAWRNNSIPNSFLRDIAAELFSKHILLLVDTALSRARAMEWDV